MMYLLACEVHVLGAILRPMVRAKGQLKDSGKPE